MSCNLAIIRRFSISLRLVESGSCAVSNDDAVNLYMRAKPPGSASILSTATLLGPGYTRPKLVVGGDGWLLYLCATDSCTTDGHNPHKAMAGYAAVAAKRFPASNEQGLRLFVGAAWRKAAARNLHAAPIFSFHAPSSSFRVMMRLEKPKRPPAAAYDSLPHVSAAALWAAGVCPKRPIGPGCGAIGVQLQQRGGVCGRQRSENGE